MKKNKIIFYTIGAVIIAALTICAVSANNGNLTFEEFWRVLTGAKPFWLVMACISMFGFIFFEAESLLVILKGAGYQKSLSQGLLYSAGDIYFSAITPSASGGQPASAYFMLRDGISGAVTTVVLVANLVMYTMALLTVALFCLIFKWDIFLRFDFLARVLIFVGIGVLIVCAILFMALLRHGEWLSKIGSGIVRFFAKLRFIKNPEKWHIKMQTTVEDYRRCAGIISGKRRMLGTVYLMTLLQRISQITVALFVYYALGGSVAGSSDIWAIQAYAQVGSNTLPIPGGMGVADYLMMNGYTAFFSRESAFQLSMISRGISFYLCTLLGLLLVIIGYLIGRARRKRQNEA